ncbi:MAG TPA: aspartate--ammonia ligase [Firmicutes bacterium]|uniref:Aspartate--ammonia ligase n=1 Tax=Capillibacterium thermochitinicola TaxID=2699427 RepID=A0A8J6I140_9FIRM|nr:aspartate--ammonia ligase [Capillibacterium thermochitinicola]MBA2133725.1 aspartate--ammonia ligase [Capillibacterium thermochitinicola]HHW11889.1 aspartate--ammonia ligase [Bacillota bacterium]
MVELFHSVCIPKDYRSLLGIKDTQIAIKKLKDYFENALAKELGLVRVSAPLFVTPESGLNDNLTGTERPVSFDVKALNGQRCEIVQSLAKWKRMALQKYGFGPGEGLYTDMNAIRRDENLDNLHSIYVDQWDWEKVIRREERTVETLKETVRAIYRVLQSTEAYIRQYFPELPVELPPEIKFITAQELEDRYPDATPKAREDLIAREWGAVFIMKIGGTLKSGQRHDGRAPDYDDWNLNGDIILWYDLLGKALEISSMGIRVDAESLRRQVKEAGCEERLALTYHQDLLAGRLPYTIGGGIGQSRLCMYFLKKAHIGEVQSSVWPDHMIKACREGEIFLL